MGCMCVDCRFAEGTEENRALCGNWDSENYGSEMDLVKKAMEE